MWGKKDEGAPLPSPAERSQPQGETPPEAARPAPAAAAPVERGGRSQAQIGKSLHLKGDISGSEDLYIDGEVQGTVELKENNLTVGPNGNLQANISARSITVLGRVQGDVRAGERIEIRKSGSIEGDLTTARIIIEDGAVFRGSIDIVQPGQLGAPPVGERKPGSAAPEKAASVPAASAGATGLSSAGAARSPKP